MTAVPELPRTPRPPFHRRRFRAPSFAATALAVCLAAALCLAGRIHAGPAPQSAARRMAGAARDFLASLDDAGREKARAAFDDPDRTAWHFVPKPRTGVPLGDLSRAQSHLAEALLASALGSGGSMRTHRIMSLEQVLREVESAAGDSNAPLRRDPDKYYIRVYGDPGADPDGPWAWRIEGHHVSLHFTVVAGRVATGPQFLGSNPHEVRAGPLAGMRPLGEEEDVARELLASLDDAGRARAIVGPTAPPDILTGNATRATWDEAPVGLPASAMTPAQRAILARLLALYVETPLDDVAEDRRSRVREAMARAEAGGAEGDVHFAWLGGVEPGQGHYYRVQGAEFLVEYDNTQNDANHSHSAWRDFDGDFGFDLLAAHARASHSAPASAAGE